MIPRMTRKAIRHAFANQLRRLRLKHNLTQEELAELAGVSDKYIQMLESKSPRNPSLEVIERIAHAFGLPPWKLLKFK